MHSIRTHFFLCPGTMISVNARSTYTCDLGMGSELFQRYHLLCEMEGVRHSRMLTKFLRAFMGYYIEISATVTKFY